MYKSLFIKTTAVSVVAALTLGVVSPIVVSASGNTGPHTDNSNTVSTGEVQQALAYTPGVLGASDTTKVSTDVDSAAVSNTAGSTVDIPKDPEQGVTFGANNGPKIEVDLPNADDATQGKQIAPGVVAYASGDGSANAVQANEDGSVRMLTVIDNPKAPTEYSYKVTVPNGGKIELADFGGAQVLSTDGAIISAVGAPWAKDANGTPVNTWFTTDGITLTQHVEHDVPGVVYPVTADPFWLPVVALALVRACGWGAAWNSFLYISQNGFNPRHFPRTVFWGCVGGMIVRQFPWLIRW